MNFKKIVVGNKIMEKSKGQAIGYIDNYYLNSNTSDNTKHSFYSINVIQ